MADPHYQVNPSAQIPGPQQHMYSSSSSSSGSGGVISSSSTASAASTPFLHLKQKQLYYHQQQQQQQQQQHFPYRSTPTHQQHSVQMQDDEQQQQHPFHPHHHHHYLQQHHQSHQPQYQYPPHHHDSTRKPQMYEEEAEGGHELEEDFEEEDDDELLAGMRHGLGALLRRHAAAAEPIRPPRPLPKLELFPKRDPEKNALGRATVHLLQTMEQINSNYYENRRIAKRVDDAEHNYRVRRGEILNHRYLVVRALGKGSFGIVVLAADYLWRVETERLPVYSRHPGVPYFRDLPHDPRAPVEFLGFATRGHLLMALAPVGPDGWLYHSLGWSLVRGPRTTTTTHHPGVPHGIPPAAAAATGETMEEERMEMEEDEGDVDADDHFALRVPPDLDHPFFLLPDRFPHISAYQQQTHLQQQRQYHQQQQQQQLYRQHGAIHPSSSPPQQHREPVEEDTDPQQPPPIEHTLAMMSRCMCSACAVWYIRRDLNWTAIKIVKSKSSFDRQAQIEVQLLNRIRHLGGTQHFIVALTDSFRVASHQCLVFELLGPNLYTVLQNRKFRGFPLRDLADLATQLLESMAFLHNMRPLPVIHCDLKPENILVLDPDPKTADMGSGVRVADFGSASTLTSRGQMISYVQSRFYRAPEVILGLPYTTQIDMWSIGCILAEMFLARPLFDGRSEEEQITRYCEFLGLPPQRMICRSPKRERFFVLRPTSSSAPSHGDGGDGGGGGGRWTLKPELREKYRSKTRRFRFNRKRQANHPLWDRILEAAGEQDPGWSSGASSSETYSRYRKFENLLLGLLRMDPESRLRPEEALLHSFLSWIPPAPSPPSPSASASMQTEEEQEERIRMTPSSSSSSISRRMIATQSQQQQQRRRNLSQRSGGGGSGGASRSPSRPKHLIQPKPAGHRGSSSSSKFSRNSLPSSWTYPAGGQEEEEGQELLEEDGEEEGESIDSGPAFRQTPRSRTHRRVLSGSGRSHQKKQEQQQQKEEGQEEEGQVISPSSSSSASSSYSEMRIDSDDQKQPTAAAAAAAAEEQQHPRHGMMTRSRRAAQRMRSHMDRPE